MRKGGGKAKGSQFEREVCVLLSRWVTNGAQEDVFWRSAMSGGRATVAKAHGKSLANQVGDISCIDPAGLCLTNRFLIETKFYKDLNFNGLILKKGNTFNFWNIASNEAIKFKKIPMLIARQNRFPTILFTSYLGAHFLNSPINTMFPQLEMNAFLFEDIINKPFIETRLLNYNYEVALRDFYHHKRGAADRSIEFEFEFEEWVSWWEKNLGMNWQNLRGRRATQYVMARNDDIGPYAADNVKCITQSENASERKLNGTAARGIKIATSKLTEEQVIAIFYDDRHSTEIAKDYGMGHHMIRFIKKKKYWKHVLSDL